MKTKFLAIVMAVATAAGTAAAADLPRNPAPYYYPPPAIYNWTGFYAGLNLGYQWGSVSNFSGNPSGIAGGGQIGYNCKSDNLSSALRQTFRRAQQTTHSRRGNSPIRGLARCAAALAMQ
jgi:opacity protein-like surface antigen